jgi:hypothetical protein
MKEILKSFFEVSKERMKNPLIGTFMITWVLINWKPIFIALLSKKTIVERIDFIELNYSSIYSYLTIPLAIALFYVIVLPYLMWGIDELMQKATTGRKKNLTKQIIIDYKGKQQIAIEESELEDKKAGYRDKADFNKQIEQLRNQLDERDNELKRQTIELKEIAEENLNLKNFVSSNNNDKSESQNTLFNNLYEEFKESDLYDYFKDVGVKIRNNQGFPHGINEIIQEKFLIQNIVEEVKEENNFYYQLTNKGLYFWRKYLNSIRVTKNIEPSNDIDNDLPF